MIQKLPNFCTPSDQAALAAGFRYCPEKAAAALTWLRDNFGLRPYRWQQEILEAYFGWRDAQGRYRFTGISAWLPKKNGKSFIISSLLAEKLFELKGARIYSVAYNSKQAQIVLDGTIGLLKAAPKFRPLLGKKIKAFSSPYRREVATSLTGSVYQALADNINANDGLIGQVLVLDELHRMKNALADVCLGMTSNMPGALTVIISTAGDGDKTHRSWQKYAYAKAVRDGTIIDPHLLPVIHECLDNLDGAGPDEIYSLDRLVACNPVLQEDPERRARAEQEIQEARQIRNDAWWRRYRLNQWLVTDGDPYVAPGLYDAAQVELPAEDDLAGARCWVGFDRGGSSDFSGLCEIFELGEGRYFERHLAFAQADCLVAMEARDDMDYRQFVERGELVLIPAEAVADEWLAEWLQAHLQHRRLEAFAADPHRAAYILETLAAGGLPVYQVNQSNNALLTPVIDDYLERVRQRRLVHAPSSLYSWQLSCARKIPAAKDRSKIVKAGSNAKGDGGRGHIDNVDAALDALAAVRATEIKEAAGGQSSGIAVA